MVFRSTGPSFRTKASADTTTTSHPQLALSFPTALAAPAQSRSLAQRPAIMDSINDDSPWDDNPKTIVDSEWSKISSDFQNAGYREGITAGKESSLQQGFDQAFAQIGAPLGRHLGFLRGISSALTSFLNHPHNSDNSNPDSPNLHFKSSSAAFASIQDTDKRERLLQQAREISSALNDIRFSDVVPPDLEAQRHAREHLVPEDSSTSIQDDEHEMDIDLGEEITNKREMENLEDMFNRMGADSSSPRENARPTLHDVQLLSERLRALAQELGLPLPPLS